MRILVQLLRYSAAILGFGIGVGVILGSVLPRTTSDAAIWAVVSVGVIVGIVCTWGTRDAARWSGRWTLIPLGLAALVAGGYLRHLAGRELEAAEAAGESLSDLAGLIENFLGLFLIAMGLWLVLTRFARRRAQ